MKQGTIAEIQLDFTRTEHKLSDAELIIMHAQTIKPEDDLIAQHQEILDHFASLDIQISEAYSDVLYIAIYEAMQLKQNLSPLTNLTLKLVVSVDYLQQQAVERLKDS